MKKTILLILAALLVTLVASSFANAITQEEIKEAKSLIDSTAPCKSLSDSQLELIGEYEMELMHPGQSHKAMHDAMGVQEGSEQEEQLHIHMAKTMYCNESKGMMDMKMGEGGMMGSGGMMDRGMMDMKMGGGELIGGGGMMGGEGMMGTYGFNVLYAVLLVGLIILVFLAIIKLWRDLYRTKEK